MANFPYYPSFSFSSLTTICTNLCMNCDRNIHASSKTTSSCLFWENTISSTRCGFPIWTPEHFQGEYFVAKAVWQCNLVKVLGQQPRYQRLPSSITMWQLFHREPSVSSRHHQLLTLQPLPIYMPWRLWGHRPRNTGSIAREKFKQQRFPSQQGTRNSNSMMDLF